MRKIVVISICCLYMVSSLGVTMQSHYCMGRLTSSSFQAQKPDFKCPKCGMTKKKKGCCENKSKTFKIQCDQQVSITTIGFPPLHLVAISPVLFLFSPNFSLTFLTDIGLPVGHAPPYLRKVALHLFHCILLN